MLIRRLTSFSVTSGNCRASRNGSVPRLTVWKRNSAGSGPSSSGLNEALQAATDHLAELEAELAELTDQAAATAREVGNLSDRQSRQQTQLGGPRARLVPTRWD